MSDQYRELLAEANPDEVREWLANKEADTAAELEMSSGKAGAELARVQQVKRDKAIELARRILSMTEELFSDPYNHVDGFSAEAWMNLSASIGWKAVTQHFRHRKWADFWERRDLEMLSQGADFGGTDFEIDEKGGNEVKIKRNRRAAEEYEIWVHASEYIHGIAVKALEQSEDWQGRTFYPNHGFDIGEKAFAKFCEDDEARFQARRRRDNQANRMASAIDSNTQLHFLADGS